MVNCGQPLGIPPGAIFGPGPRLPSWGKRVVPFGGIIRRIWIWFARQISPKIWQGQNKLPGFILGRDLFCIWREYLVREIKPPEANIKSNIVKPITQEGMLVGRLPNKGAQQCPSNGGGGSEAGGEAGERTGSVGGLQRTVDTQGREHDGSEGRATRWGTEAGSSPGGGGAPWQQSPLCVLGGSSGVVGGLLDFCLLI